MQSSRLSGGFRSRHRGNRRGRCRRRGRWRPAPVPRRAACGRYADRADELLRDAQVPTSAESGLSARSSWTVKLRFLLSAMGNRHGINRRFRRADCQHTAIIKPCRRPCRAVHRTGRPAPRLPGWLRCSSASASATSCGPSRSTPSSRWSCPAARASTRWPRSGRGRRGGRCCWRRGPAGPALWLPQRCISPCSGEHQHGADGGTSRAMRVASLARLPSADPDGHERAGDFGVTLRVGG